MVVVREGLPCESDVSAEVWKMNRKPGVGRSGGPEHSGL